MPIQVYSFYIFDRHTECVYSKLWVPRPIPSSSITSPPSSRPPSQQPSSALQQQQQIQQQHQHPHHSTTTTTASNTIAVPQPPAPTTSSSNTGGPPGPRRRGKGTAASDDAKLIFGTVFSLRNMVRKLGGEDDAFIAFRTQHYKLHYYETPTNLRFAMLTEPGALSMRNVLHQIYINLWVEYVVKNPLSPVEHKGGEGVKNEMFEMGLDKFIRGLM
ncbi:snare-like protein [Hypoxylon fragiforme]|uniref:snare-like protein n=1 Tax=Hypoxylon fragiforme TaxID=63214 RepID=UPI0020C5CFA0|nr:snare-like protein [Hypoxylon fragiforme]KAI2612462.1 snare-like protein [Hypoxylon fragiforme]